MFPFKRESVETGFQIGYSRLRIPANVGVALGLDVRQDVEMVGFLREREELVCTPTGEQVAESLASVLAIEAAHEGQEVVQPELESLPPTKVIIAPSRIVRFQLKWISEKQIDLQFKKGVAELLGRNDQKNRVRVLTWKGWLVVMSAERYQEQLLQPW